MARIPDTEVVCSKLGSRCCSTLGLRGFGRVWGVREQKDCRAGIPKDLGVYVLGIFDAWWRELGRVRERFAAVWREVER